jgi:hypothetical protein
LLSNNELAVVVTCLCTTRTTYGQPVTRPETKKENWKKGYQIHVSPDISPLVLGNFEEMTEFCANSL